MGKRKERRLAAKTASNRRVKLDLLAEPSGDFGESSNKEEVGGGDSANNHAGSPNSPSSSEFRHFIKISGQKPENPLLLLGQYSDEELEEESGKEISNDAGENSPAEFDEQQLKVDGHEGTEGDKDENLTADKVDQENKEHASSLDILTKLEENGVIEDNTAVIGNIDADAVDQTSVPWTSDKQATGDADSGWKMVLHEESNSYYYWNIATGETSWEVPAVLAQGNEPAGDTKSAPEVEEMHVTSLDTHIPDRALEVEMDASVATQPNSGSPNTMVLEDGEITGSSPQLEVPNDKDDGNHVEAIDGRKMSSPDAAGYGSSHRGFGRHSNDSFSNREAHGTDSSIEDTRDRVNHGRAADPCSDSLRLLQLGENLLERLKSLKGSEGFSDQISKLMFELDIRLADIKSLVPYGSSLLPFWLHSEDHLKKLEAAVNNQVLKCSQLSNIAEMNETANKLQENICEATANEKKAASTSFDVDASDHASLRKDAEKVSSGVEEHGNAFSADIAPNVGPNSSEDVDMDVEMEVEDAIPFRDETGASNAVQPDHQSNPSNLPTEPHKFEEFEVPPPPNDEWIPPPPPDDEPLPPPPPDEPHEVPFPPQPSEMQTAQPYSYGEQYNFTYPGSSFDYYGQTNTVPSNEYYVDANGCQVAAPLATLYYSAVPHPYPDATSVVNPTEPVSYYALQEGSVSTAPVVGSVETFDKTESITAWNDKPLSSSRVEVNAVDRQIAKPSTEAPSISSSTHVSATPASAVSTTVSSTEPVPKAQPKVSRKKRTVSTVNTLRSNKKVSGLVDKWKAVKEELHEDEEDEPENAYEVLEKKRQREIEQWHAQQIATGEAKDNANFQPLGGDWRERVRRKRAKKSIEAEENQAKAVDDANQQPDLVELSKQLPSGWQAYWDEGSKLVYYGNSTTSETTWIKPTN